jgi:periplasmic divalent cation tolerance protein
MANSQPAVSTQNSIKVVISTFPNAENAREKAKNLIDLGHASCVNIIPIATSVYRWEGKIVEDSECYLIAKCLEEKLNLVLAAIKDQHPYSTPFIASFDLSLHNRNYLNWMNGALDS